MLLEQHAYNAVQGVGTFFFHYRLRLDLRPKDKYVFYLKRPLHLNNYLTYVIHTKNHNVI